MVFQIWVSRKWCPSCKYKVQYDIIYVATQFRLQLEIILKSLSLNMNHRKITPGLQQYKVQYDIIISTMLQRSLGCNSSLL